jgi:hypothetical protein
MPHDRDGELLKVGDEVNIPCRVKEIQMTEEFCNCTLESNQPMYPGNNRSSFVVNTKQVV